MKKKVICIIATVIAGGIMHNQSAECGDLKLPPSGREFSREEYMVLNLNRGDDSAGAHVGEAIKQVRVIVKDLDRSLRQLQQVDREFAKSKGKPDDKFLGPAADRLQQALKSAQQLQQDLELSRDELKDNIHEALIMAH